MGRPHAAWFTSLGLLGVGWLTAHVLSYLIVVPNAHERAQVLAQTGHGYFRPADLVILCATIALAGLALCVIEPRRRHRRPSPQVLAALPLAGFVVQEHVERLAVTGSFPAHLIAEPRFLVGVLLQVPFAIAALLVARALLRTAIRLLRTAGALPTHPLSFARLGRAVRLCAADALRQPCLALGYSERGPPPPPSG